MWNKAQTLIAADSLAAWREANTLANGKRRKHHKPYVISARAQAMVEALRANDADVTASLIRDWEHISPAG
jgi:poly(3-hydroxybutyrate) depolymerase